MQEVSRTEVAMFAFKSTFTVARGLGLGLVVGRADSKSFACES